MISTRDGHSLSIGDECLVVSFEEDSSFIERSTKCIYKGSWVRDNRPFLATLPPGCSGSHTPETQTMHHFEYIYHEDEGFNLLECDVQNMVIKDSSYIEEVVKKKLKD